MLFACALRAALVWWNLSHMIPVSVQIAEIISSAPHCPMDLPYMKTKCSIFCNQHQGLPLDSGRALSGFVNLVTDIPCQSYRLLPFFQT